MELWNGYKLQPKHPLICTAHFEPQMLRPQNEKCPEKRVLQEFAVPTLHDLSISDFSTIEYLEIEPLDSESLGRRNNFDERYVYIQLSYISTLTYYITHCSILCAEQEHVENYLSDTTMIDSVDASSKSYERYKHYALFLQSN